MESKNKVFLETTIQITRRSGDLERKEKIEKFIIQYQKRITSSYVKMEFKRRYIGDLVYLFNLISDADNFCDVYDKLKILPPVQHRRISGILGSFGHFFLDIKDNKTTQSIGDYLLEAGYIFFKNAIELSWQDFDKNIDNILDETDCLNAKSGPVLKKARFYNQLSCKQNGKVCKMKEFVLKNREFLKKIYDKLSHIENLDDEQKKTKGIVEGALKYPQNMANYKNCSSCGDVIISLECPEDTEIFTTNTKHFSPICEAIGKIVVSGELGN